MSTQSAVSLYGCYAETYRRSVEAVNGSYGSGSDGRALGFIAAKLPLKVRFPKAAAGQ